MPDVNAIVSIRPFPLAKNNTYFSPPEMAEYLRLDVIEVFRMGYRAACITI